MLEKHCGGAEVVAFHAVRMRRGVNSQSKIPIEVLSSVPFLSSLGVCVCVFVLVTVACESARFPPQERALGNRKRGFGVGIGFVSSHTLPRALLVSGSRIPWHSCLRLLVFLLLISHLCHQHTFSTHTLTHTHSYSHIRHVRTQPKALSFKKSSRLIVS